MAVLDCPECDEGYDEEGPRACCGVYTLTCYEHGDDWVEWVEATGQVVTYGCVCEKKISTR